MQEPATKQQIIEYILELEEPSSILELKSQFPKADAALLKEALSELEKENKMYEDACLSDPSPTDSI